MYSRKSNCGTSHPSSAFICQARRYIINERSYENIFLYNLLLSHLSLSPPPTAPVGSNFLQPWNGWILDKYSNFNYEKPKPPLETSNPYKTFLFLCVHKWNSNKDGILYIGPYLQRVTLAFSGAEELCIVYYLYICVHRKKNKNRTKEKECWV